MLRIRPIRALTLMLLLCPQLLWGQRDHNYNEARQKVNQIIESTLTLYDSVLLLQQQDVWGSTGPLQFDWSAYQQDEELKLYNTASYWARKMVRGKTGLSLVGSYNYNSTMAPLIGEDESFYRDRTQIGLSWDILKSSLIYRKAKLEEASLSAELDALQILSNAAEKQYKTYRDSVKKEYDGLILTLLYVRQNLFNKRVACYEYLYRSSDIPISELYNILYESRQNKNKVDVLRIASGVKPSRRQIDPLSYYRINNAVYSQEALARSRDLYALNKHKQFLEAQKKQTNILSKITVAPYVRYQYVSYPGNPNRSNFQAGVQLNVPLSGEFRSQRELTNLHLQIEESNERKLQTDLLLDLNRKMEEYYQILEKMQSTIYRVYSHKVQSLFNAYTFSQVHQMMNGLNALRELDKYLETVIELYEQRLEYDLHLLDFEYLVEGIPIELYATEGRFSRGLQRRENPSTVYIWDVNQFDEMMLSSVAWQNNFNPVYIGFSRKTDPQRYSSLWLKLKSFGVDMHLCLSNHLWINKTDVEILEYFHTLDSIPLDGLHLDLEPHQFPDWDTQKEKYLANLDHFVDLLNTWRASKPIKLTAAFPYNYPEDFLTLMDDKTDGLTLMMYNKSIDSIFQKIEQSPLLSRIKFEVAVRPEDFLLTGEALVDSLFKNPHIRSVAFESFSTYLTSQSTSAHIKWVPENQTYTLCIHNLDYLLRNETLSLALIEAFVAKEFKHAFPTKVMKDNDGNLTLEIRQFKRAKDVTAVFGEIIRNYRKFN